MDNMIRFDVTSSDFSNIRRKLSLSQLHDETIVESFLYTLTNGQEMLYIGTCLNNGSMVHTNIETYKLGDELLQKLFCNNWKKKMKDVNIEFMISVWHRKWKQHLSYLNEDFIQNYWNIDNAHFWKWELETEEFKKSIL